MELEWDEPKRRLTLERGGVDLTDAALVLLGPTIVTGIDAMTTAKRATSRRAKSTESTTPSSTPNVVTHSVSSLLGELDESPDTDIRRVTATELFQMKRRGELYPTRP